MDCGLVVYSHARASKISQDAVVKLGCGILPDEQTAVAAGVGPGTNPSGVVNLETGHGQSSDSNPVGLSVPLAAVVLFALLLNGEPELVLAPVTLVDVKRIIVIERADQVFGVDGAAEELEAIIGCGEGFDILQRGAAANRAQRQSVEFFVRLEDHAGMADGDIAHDSGGIVVVRAAEAIDKLAIDLGVGQSFEDIVLWVGGVASSIGGGVDDTFAHQDDAAPQAALEKRQIIGIINVVCFGCEDDRAVGRAVGKDFSATSNDETGGVGILARFGFDDRARFDVQRPALQHVDEAVEDVLIGMGPGFYSTDAFRNLDVPCESIASREQARREG